MNSKIVETLEMMCDKDNPQDKKLLLLAELVETKCEALADNHGELKRSLEKTNDKLDKVTTLLEKIEANESSCPVYRNKEQFSRVSFFMKYPKVTFLLIIGAAALAAGILGSTSVDIIKLILGI